MNLPDFGKFKPFVDLRRSMGASEAVWVAQAWDAVDGDDLVRQLRTTGIEVEDISEITTASDGTFEYKGEKVLVYIRDQISYSGRERVYKFHISHCRTISDAFASNRESRYVVSSRDDGRFVVNRFSGERLVEEHVLRELSVCKNCLKNLEYQGYSDHHGAKSLAVYRRFDLEAFFEEYGGSRIVRKPLHSDTSAPLNVYTPDFSSTSKTIRQQHGYKCDACGLGLTQHPQFLHVHHRNADKSDNRITNLTVLCIGCHAEEPMHRHVQNSPTYGQFLGSHEAAWRSLRAAMK